MKEKWQMGLKFTKSGIVFFSYICALMGYFLGWLPGQSFVLSDFLLFSLGLVLLAAGSCGFNQVQEAETDLRMQRTCHRPIPSGDMAWITGFCLSLLLIIVGLFALFLLKPLVASLGLLTLILYNGAYTLWWKPYMTFGAVLGAIPGAMPVVIGYFASRDLQAVGPECFYLFLILFLWQMPHFWSLAIRYKEDYKKAGIPVLPAQLGRERTLYHIGLYVFTYISVALASPWFVNAHFFYMLLVIPFSGLVLYEFFRFAKQSGKNGWLRFFLWINASLFVFLIVPVIDKWIGILIRSYDLTW